MYKTRRIAKLELLNEIVEDLDNEKVSFNPYGTSNEDSYLSGINEGLTRAIDLVFDYIERTNNKKWKTF